uniref:Immunoglobulin subtype domain-containing protein n=1 Tax=Cyprinus carpio TaxID=7962 RepID=A0A8C2J311_CYPCA
MILLQIIFTSVHLSFYTEPVLKSLSFHICGMKMFDRFWFCLCLWRLVGVFGDEMKFVKLGDSVTLNSGLTELMDNDQIQWRFWIGNTSIAEINVTADSMTVYDDVLDGRFRDRLKLDKQTGSLTITNITTEHNGVYLGVVINRTSIPFFLAVYGELHIHSTCFIFIYFLITRYNINPHTILLLWCLFCCFILLFI